MSINNLIAKKTRAAMASGSNLRSLSTRAITTNGELLSFSDEQHCLLEYCPNPSSNTRTFILNRPKSLHALNTEMCAGILNRVMHHDLNGKVKCLVLTSKDTKGRAFCSGGDIRNVCLAAIEKDFGFIENFFHQEYAMDYVLGSLKSLSVVSILDGIVMGGGVGLSVNGRFRVATENTVFAMPECSIGLYPEAGTSYFLPRLPKGLGKYLGLTGTRLKGKSVKDIGIATHFVHSKEIDDLIRKLNTANIQNEQDILSILSEFDDDSIVGDKISKLDVIQDCFSSNSVEEIIQKLQDKAEKESQPDDKILTDILLNLKKQCPTSLKIAFQSLDRGALMSLADCMKMEYRVSARCVRRHDFAAGVTSALITKDRNPTWKPDRLDQVTKQQVESFFVPFSQDLNIPELQLPAAYTSERDIPDGIQSML